MSTQRLGQVDRDLGRAIRLAARESGSEPALRLAGNALSPAFRVLAVLMALRRPTRTAGIAALAGAVVAASAAKVLRDAIGRPRPGARAEGGMPSRHAAAATAIASAAGRHGVGGPVVAVAAATGLLGRVVTGDHDPLDIAAGALVGLAAAGTVARGLSLLSGRR